MATPADFTTRARDEMYSIYTSYQALRRRVDDLTDEVTAAGGASGRGNGRTIRGGTWTTYRRHRHW